MPNLIIFFITIFVMTLIIVLTLIFTRKGNSTEIFTKQIDDLKNSNTILETKNREIEKQNIDYKIQLNDINNKYQKVLELKSQLDEQIAKFKAEDIEKENQLDRKIKELSAAKDALDDDRKRINKEDEAAKKFEIDNKNRVWKEHEDLVIDTMLESCKKEDTKFELYTNTNVPEGFDTKFKPDSMIDFLSQYVIFDAKHSTSVDYDNFLKKQAEDTVSKIKNSLSKDRIYKTLFLVVPAIDLQNIKKFIYNVDGYVVYIISIFCVAPILSIFKKMENYEFVKEFTPEDRENIIDLLASYEHHIRQSNSENIFATVRGLNVIKKNDGLNIKFKKELDDYRNKLKISQVGLSSLKNSMNNLEIQYSELNTSAKKCLEEKL